MATFFFDQMTQANADAFNNATDTIVFRAGSASQATVLYNPLSFNGPPSVTLALGGNSVIFANDGAQVRGLATVGLFTDGSKLYIGSTGNDAVTGTAGADGLFGGAGNDSLVGGTGGNDLLQGNQGDDTLVASTGGLNTIFGGQVDDSIDTSAAGKSASATNFAQGNLGNDTIIGSANADTILGGQGDDSISVTTGKAGDYLDGNLGNDTITAGGGLGVNGHDVISGGGGNDQFVFAAGTSLANANNAEVITDWTSADHLQIGVLGAGGATFFGSDTVAAANFNAAITQADTDFQAHLTDKYIAIQVGSDVVIFADTNTAGGSAGHITAADDAIILTGKSLTDITGANFI